MKLDVYEFGKQLEKRGFDFFCGVPCSFLSDLINYAVNDAEFIMSNNEGDASAVCAGAYLGGRKPVVLMQNSGLTNALSPLTSLNYSFRIPVLGFVSLRGEPGIGDEPQHELMGTVTGKMLSIADVEWEYLSGDPDEAEKQLDRADKAFSENKRFFFIVRKGTFSKVVLKKLDSHITANKEYIPRSSDDEMPLRLEVLRNLSQCRRDNTVLLATTGKTGRELFEEADLPGNFYMVGSMGSISSIGLGLALNIKNPVIAVDGDGALLMRMGNLATNGYYAPKNFLHILIDNNSHDSTGGQFTVSGNVDFSSIAKSCGYTRSIYIHSLSELEYHVNRWHENPELTFMHIRVRKGTKENLGRPSVRPHEVKERLMRFLGSY